MDEATLEMSRTSGVPREIADHAPVAQMGSRVLAPAAATGVATLIATAERDSPSTERIAPSPTITDGFDLICSTAIGKGTGGQPFMISWHSQREVVQSLAWKSALCIWGGPILTLVSVYLLILDLGWI